MKKTLVFSLVVSAAVVVGAAGQTHGVRERYTAFAVNKQQVELENYGTQPVLLQSIKREAVR